MHYSRYVVTRFPQSLIHKSTTITSKLKLPARFSPNHSKLNRTVVHCVCRESALTLLLVLFGLISSYREAVCTALALSSRVSLSQTGSSRIILACASSSLLLSRSCSSISVDESFLASGNARELILAFPTTLKHRSRNFSCPPCRVGPIATGCGRALARILEIGNGGSTV